MSKFGSKFKKMDVSKFGGKFGLQSLGSKLGTNTLPDAAAGSQPEVEGPLDGSAANSSGASWMD